MPLGKDVRYRVKTTSSGRRVRLAFRGSQVVEAKNIDSGATHTPSEFAADRRRVRRRVRRRRTSARKPLSGLRSRLHAIRRRLTKQ